MGQKIILTVTNDLSNDQRMIRIAGTLAQAGFEPVLIGRQLPESLPLSQRAFQQVRLRCRYHKGKLFYLEYNLRLLRFLRKQQADLICAIDLDTLVAGYLAARHKEVLLVYDAHEYFTELPELQGRPLTRFIWRIIARLIVPRVDAAYTVGACLQEIFSKRYGIPFGLIRNMPTDKKASSTIDFKLPEERIILYQGVLNQGRGLETAILAMHQLDGMVLWLAGEGDLSGDLRELARTEGLDHKVRFLGKLSPEHLQQLTPVASLGLNLFANLGLNYYYSLANKTFDYIRAGVPAIHMDFPEYRQIVSKYNVGVLLSDIEASTLVAAVQEVVSDEQAYQQMKNACQQAAKEFSWEQEEEKLIKIYQHLLPE